MEIKYTSKGISHCNFKDGNGENCSIQESSAAEQAYIWLGCDEIGLKGFIPNGDPSWRDVTKEQVQEKFGFKHIIANNRMHLTQEQVKELIPILQKFVDTGSIA